MDKALVINESDCCGNGCIHCVLNVGLRKSFFVDRHGKQNVISDYQKFQLIGSREHNPKGEDTHNENELPEVVELYFTVADLPTKASDYILDIPVGYHLMMRTNLPNGLAWLRPYSPFWVDALAMQFKILVNLMPNGHMSQFINSLQLGDLVEFRGPIGAYEHSTGGDKERCVFIISQGVAIAPTLPIVQRILDDEDDFSRVVQLVCYSDLQHAYFRHMLRDFNKYWNYTNRIYLAHQQCPPEMCKEAKCTDKCQWFLKNLWYKELVYLRRLTETELVDVCKGVKQDATIEFVIAGGRKFQEAVSKMITNSNIEVPDKHICLL